VASCIGFFKQSVPPPPEDLATLKRFMFQDNDLSNHTKKLRELEDAGEEDAFGTWSGNDSEPEDSVPLGKRSRRVAVAEKTAEKKKVTEEKTNKGKQPANAPSKKAKVISPKKKITVEPKVFGNVAQARMWYLSLIDRWQKAVGDAWKFIGLAHEVKYPTYPAVLADLLAREPKWPPPPEMGGADSKKAAGGRNPKSSTPADLGGRASLAGTLNDKDKDLQTGGAGSQPSRPGFSRFLRGVRRDVEGTSGDEGAGGGSSSGIAEASGGPKRDAKRAEPAVQAARATEQPAQRQV
jgi:hypothetical protein